MVDIIHVHLINKAGAPCQTYALEDLQQTWGLLYDAISQGSVIVASIQSGLGNLSDQEIYKRGLNPLYANAVLDISLTESVPFNERMIEIRNIWNEEYVWQGQFRYTL